MVPPSDLSVELEALQTSYGPDRGCWLTGWACISARDFEGPLHDTGAWRVSRTNPSSVRDHTGVSPLSWVFLKYALSRARGGFPRLGFRGAPVSRKSNRHDQWLPTGFNIAGRSLPRKNCGLPMLIQARGHATTRVAIRNSKFEI